MKNKRAEEYFAIDADSVMLLTCDNLSPLVKKGDVLYIKKQKEFKDGDLVFLRYGNGLICGFWFYDYINDVYLVSFPNPDYQPYVLADEDLKDFEKVGVIVGFYRSTCSVRVREVEK